MGCGLRGAWIWVEVAELLQHTGSPYWPCGGWDGLMGCAAEAHQESLLARWVCIRYGTRED